MEWFEFFRIMCLNWQDQPRSPGFDAMFVFVVDPFYQSNWDKFRLPRSLVLKLDLERLKHWEPSCSNLATDGIFQRHPITGDYVRIIEK